MPQNETKGEYYRWVNVLHENTIRKLELEEYVTGVLLGEMPTSFHIEALKAQAVAIRTYTLQKMSVGTKHDLADVCTESACCQAYIPLSTENSVTTQQSRAQQAVRETNGQVLTYKGELIEATYFSASGGKTEAAKDVWGKNRAYLQSKVSAGENENPYHENQISISMDDFINKLELDKGQPIKISDIHYTHGGGVSTLRIANQEFTGIEIRKRLSLNSTAFSIAITDGQVRITTKGKGHRVGMSQYGAEAMAQEGKTYDEILSYYYSGAKLIDWRL